MTAWGTEPIQWAGVQPNVSWFPELDQPTPTGQSRGEVCGLSAKRTTIAYFFLGMSGFKEIEVSFCLDYVGSLSFWLQQRRLASHGSPVRVNRMG